jgi:thermosome
MMQGQPVYILREGTQRETGKGAYHNNIAAAVAIADTVRSTLGPKGMDKMMVDTMGDVVITNDGVTILKEMDVSHPAAKMMVEIAKVQDAESGDGTTSAVILGGELLKQAESLLERDIHATTITAGYKLASEKALKMLDEISDKVDSKDVKLLRNVAATSMMSKSVMGIRDFLAELAVDAVLAVAEQTKRGMKAELDNILVIKKYGGSARDTRMIDGIVIDKEVLHQSMPRHVHDARVLLLDVALEIKKTEVDAKITIDDPDKMQAFLAEEEATLRKMVETVKASGATVVICQKGIDDFAQHFLAKEGILAVRRVKKSDMEKLAKATGASIVSRIQDLSKDDLGKAGKVEEQRIGSDLMTFVMDCPSAKAVSIIIRGGTEHVVDELDRSLHDALSVVSDVVEDGKVYTGAGAAAMEMSIRLREYAASVGGREQMAIDAYASALEVLPRALVENAGLDPIDTLIELRKAHKNGQKNAGIDLSTGKVEDMFKQNIIEPFRVGKQAIESSTEAAIMILRIDDVIAAKDFSKGGGPAGAPGGMPPGMGGMPPGMGGM